MVLGAKNYVGKEQICPSKEVFSAIGSLSFEQASTIRHRGALTTVSQTFATSCQMSRHYSGDDSPDNLLRAWYLVKPTWEIRYELIKDMTDTYRIRLIASSPNGQRHEDRLGYPS